MPLPWAPSSWVVAAIRDRTWVTRGLYDQIGCSGERQPRWFEQHFRLSQYLPIRRDRERRCHLDPQNLHGSGLRHDRMIYSAERQTRLLERR